MPKQRNAGILVINCGSSSLKFSLFDSDSLLQFWSGSVSPIGEGKGTLEIKTNNHKILESRSGNFKDLAIAVNEVITWLKDKKQDYPIVAIGHRLVQGGPKHREPEIINPKLLKTLDEFVYLAPNHLPEEIQTIKTFQSAFPDVPEVACFDTAFHKNMPPHAKYYPLPAKYEDKGLIKYGFHGLSYQYILQELMAKESAAIKQNIIIAHLGNGASMAAVKNGISVDTTMGISPIGGLVMGTRSGDLDPGALLFILKQDKLTANQLDDLLSKDSGLKAIAGKSDIRELLKAEADNPKAAAALTVFCYSARKFIGALAAAMGGLDLLIFTGGIGENSTIIRSRICEGLEFIGIEISKTRNKANEPIISKNKSRVSIRVTPTNEELMIARLTVDLLNHKINNSYGNQNNE
ncbi:acetate/propionate family kinase [Pedobacter antarcticus]|uniref:acetate/propionate family kinase n=1 Tax=Pedobacter antarcticus TaxID=34086 RepID=UPI00292F1336|nr:acetate/propionate family kinase [Pedobacter antarcticus]